jgi:NAD-dependent DNA ligase
MIDGLGPSMVEKILEDQKIYTILKDKPWAILDDKFYDIYMELLSVLGPTIYGNILEQVTNKSGQYSMAHFISGLGLPGISYKTALRLCQYLKSGKLNIPVSKKAINSFMEGIVIFNTAKNEMTSFSFAPLPEKAKAIYCITGTLEQSRDAMVEFFAGYGYEFSNTVTRVTNYLIVGESPGKIKIKMATKYKIPQITKEQFIKLLTKE